MPNQNSAAVEFSPDQLDAFAESFSADQLAETEDFSPKSVTPPGDYMNPARTIEKISKSLVEGKEIAFVDLLLTGGLHAENGEVYGLGKYPLRLKLNSFTRKGRPGTTGETSNLAEYMRACGFETQGVSVGALVGQIGETLNTPVSVFVSRTDKRKKLDNGEWVGGNLKLKDFLVKHDEQGNPVYANTIVKDGVTYEATAKVVSVRAIR